MLETEYEYSFEAQWKQGPRAGASALPELRKLTSRLGFTGGKPSTVFDAKLLDFVICCHLAIAWYQKKIGKELCLRRAYFCASLLLLALIPILLVLASKYMASTTGQVTTVTTQLSAVVTGLFAFYRGISAWLDKRQVVAGYSKAASDLKELLYTFEQTWDGIATDPMRHADFDAAIGAAIMKCRAIVRHETDQYFANLAYPSLDLGSILKASSSDAGTLIQSYATKPVPSSGGPTPGPTQVVNARVNQLRQRVDELDTEMLALKAAGNNAGLTAVTAARDSALRDLRAAEADQLLAVVPAIS